MDNNGKVAGGGFQRVEVIAQLFNVSVRRIQQLTQEGIIPTTETPEGRRYELVPTIQRYVQYLSDKAYGKNTRSEKEAELREQKLEADVALKQSQGELHRLRTEIAAGRYITIEEVTADYERFFLVFKKFALALPGRLIDSLTLVGGNRLDPQEARQAEKTMQGEVRRLLLSFVVAGVTPEAKEDKGRKKRHGKE